MKVPRFQKSTALHPRRDKIDVELLMTPDDVRNYIVYQHHYCYKQVQTRFEKQAGFPKAPSSIAAVDNWIAFHREQVRLKRKNHNPQIPPSVIGKMIYELYEDQHLPISEISLIINKPRQLISEALKRYRQRLERDRLAKAKELSGTR